jgi:hypothetical protein
MRVGENIQFGQCANGFVFKKVASRFQSSSENNATPENRMGTCLRSENSPLDLEIRANPSQFAVAGNWYGHCFYKVRWDGSRDHHSASCDGGYAYPMNENKECPSGFTFQHIAAQRNGDNEQWVATCLANRTGSRAEAAPTAAIQGFCAYGYDKSKKECVHAKSGSAQERNKCANGDVFYPFNGRYGGEDGQWSGVCVKP